MMNLKLLQLFMLWMMFVTGIQAQTSVAPTFGDGSEGNPYQISTLENLYWLSQNSDCWNAHFIQIADIDASETANWAESKSDYPHGFPCIGNDTVPFTGKYNGKGFVIDSLHSYRDSYSGLFGYISKATIDSLGLINSNVEGAYYAGGIVGFCDSSTVSNCYYGGKVVAFLSFGGGLIGKASNSYIANSYTSCYITGVAIEYCGGLVAYTSASVIENCSSSGKLYDTHGSRMGGLVGSNNKTEITNSYSTCDVYGDISIGGLVCSNSGNISNCYSTGNALSSSAAGGLICNNSGNISNCYSLGKVSGRFYTGALIGSNGGNVLNCYSNVAVSSYYENVGLIGSNKEKATVSGCYYIETDRRDYYNEGDEEDVYDSTEITILTDEQMKQSSSFIRWGLDTSSVWGILEGKTYPALKSINNAPFTFSESINDNNYSYAVLLKNDYDYENEQKNLIAKVDLYSSPNDDENDFAEYLKTVEPGDKFFYYYRAGEIMEGRIDTLWGNEVYNYYDFDSISVVTLNLETNEDVTLTTYLSQLAKINSKLPHKITNTVDNGIVQLSEGNIIYTPNDNFFGTDTMQIHFLRLNIDLYVNLIFKVNSVNDAPKITSTAETSATANEVYTYALTVIDMDGDVLTYSLSNAPEGMEIDSTGLISWIPSTDVTTSGEITATVSDGELTDSEVFTISVDSEVTTDILNITQTEVKIYPNPVEATFYVSGRTGTGELYIYNAVGSLVKYISTIETGSSVDVTDLPEGIYVVKVKDKNGVATIKINKR